MGGTVVDADLREEVAVVLQQLEAPLCEVLVPPKPHLPHVRRMHAKGDEHEGE